MRKKNDKGTIQKSGIWEICMVLCIMMIFPVNIALLFSDKEKTEQQNENTFDSETEWQVLHKLAAVIPVEYEEETLKAQAIILRTNILADRQKKQSEDYKTTQEIPLLFAYRNEWGDKYNENCEKLMKAVRETKGMYLEKEGEYIRTSYFRLSNGSTRNAEECLGKNYKEFTAKVCGKDLLSKEFVWKKEMSKQQFIEKLSGVAGKRMMPEELEKMDITYVYDSTGYVLYVNLGNVCLGGEVFRDALALPSSDFEIRFENDRTVITTKGIGNGIGFCQYGANEMAKEGKDFIQLLNYFFTNIAISKTE